MKNENSNTMEGDILNEETSIYAGEKPAIIKENPKKNFNFPKIEKKTFLKFAPKFKVLIVLFCLIIITCIGLVILSIKNTKTEQTKEDVFITLPSPTPKTQSKISDLSSKVEQFKKDIEGSVVTKKLTPPNLDLDISF